MTYVETALHRPTLAPADPLVRGRDMLSVLHPNTVQERQRARMCVASNARSSGELRQLLNMLGLDVL